MSETIKILCPECSAKYRLPLEAAGRTARCKVCGTKFAVPAQKNLEDSVLDWLRDPNVEEEEAVDQPKVINMPKRAEGDSSASGSRRGPIRFRESDEPKSGVQSGAGQKPAEASRGK